MEFKYHTSKSTILGKSYGEWTVKWWQWALSIPSSKNPVMDETGNYSSINQPENVYFLAGVFAEEENTKCAKRKCNIPSNLNILIPVANCEADTIYDRQLKTDQDIINHVGNQVSGIVDKEFSINNYILQPERIKSDPLIFEIYVHPDFDKRHLGGTAKAAGDGYWVFLRPLPKGEYTLKVKGSFQKGRMKSEAIYYLKII
jgi:hypothetical protein